MTSAIALTVKTNAPKSQVLSVGPLKIALKAQPENGKANIELIKFWKKHFKQNIKIISGFTSKKKLVKILE